MNLATLGIVALVTLALGYFALVRRKRPRVIPLGTIPRAHLAKISGDDTTLPLRAIVIAAVLLGAASCQMRCAATVDSHPALSPVGTAAFNATRAIQAIDVLRDFAVDGNAQSPPLISTPNTRKVVDFHEAAVKTINASPGGWTPTVRAALDQLQTDLLPAEWARLLPYVALLKSVIEVSQ